MLRPGINNSKSLLDSMAHYLLGVGDAWRRRTAGQRNMVRKTMFVNTRSQDSKIIGVTPTAEFAPVLILEDYLRLDTKPEVADAEATGFEPAISALTGPHVRPLHHASRIRPVILPQRVVSVKENR